MGQCGGALPVAALPEAGYGQATAGTVPPGRFSAD